MGDSAEMRKIEMLTSEGRGGYFPVSGHTASTSCEYASLEVEQKEDRFLNQRVVLYSFLQKLFGFLKNVPCSL